jgi:hypothetical protein
MSQPAIFEAPVPENHYSNPYSNDEGEFFFKKAFRSIGSGLKTVVKAAARFAPILAGKLATMIPGIGVVAGHLAAKLTSHLLKEGEMEAMQMEAEFFGTNEAEAEVTNSEQAHEAALTEFLAAQAAEATTEAESEWRSPRLCRSPFGLWADSGHYDRLHQS